MPSVIQQIESKSGVIDGFAKNSQAEVERKTTERENNKKLREIVLELNKMMGLNDTKLSFTVDKASKKVVIRVVNTETQEVVRQIPSEDALKVAQHLQGLMGILYDATA